jgi:hypothetical protein
MKSELQKMIGKEASNNHSPTNRAKLLEVNETLCLWEVTSSQYELDSVGNQFIGNQFYLPIYISETIFFGI